MNEIFTKLLALYPEYSRIYGPYLRKDGRKHVLLYKQDLTDKRTLSWPKALVEVREGRRLTNDETVDHNDGNVNNNSDENLIIRKRRDHSQLDAKTLVKPLVECKLCGKEFKMTRGQLKTKKAGPFCSRECRGKYGKAVQLGGEKIIREDFSREYTTLKRARGEIG